MVIGEIFLIGDKTYMQVNKSGTLEKLPKMKWYKVLYLYIKDKVKKMSIAEIREYAKGVE